MTWPIPNRPTLKVGTTRLPASTALGFVTVTGDAATHTKGAWTELIAATTGPGSLVMVHVASTATASAATSVLIDIGIGAAASEIVLIPDIGCGYTTGTTLSPGRHWTFPVYVPSGARLSARLQSLVASKTALVAIDVFGGEPVEGSTAYATVDAYGVSAANSRGAILTSGAANTKGSWAVVAASTTFPIRALAIAVQGGGSASLFARSHLIDIGVGAAASEVVVVNDLWYADNSSEFIYDMEPANLVFRDTPIPAGTRLVARQACSSATDATCDIIVYGMR